MFDAVLIANRGEVAVRVIRACRELGVRTVAVYSDIDTNAPHVRMADEAHSLGSDPAAYLQLDRIVAIAETTRVDAVHPGYGFLSENAEFARAVAEAGMVFVGPPPDVIAQLGDKLTAHSIARAADVPVIPSTEQPTDSLEDATVFADEHGYPVAVKARFGGGGRGLRVVHGRDDLARAFAAARRESLAAFGRDECYLERYLTRPRHVEVQILADQNGTVVHLGERDCSLQRRQQKLVEESPAAGVLDHIRAQLAEAAVRLAKRAGYVNAGTCEFLLDNDGESFYFLEMNTRLQVEHPVTELVTGIDIVHAQLRISSGDGLGFDQSSVRMHGHAIEVRLNAEEPATGFAPTPGRIDALVPPMGPWVRLDTGVEAGNAVPPEYDSMIGKLVVWAPNRSGAIARMSRALDELVVSGLPTTIGFHQLAMRHEQFVAGRHSTVSVESEWDLSSLRPQNERSGTQKQNGAGPLREIELRLADRTIRVAVHGSPPPDGVRNGRRPAGRAAQIRPGDEIANEPDLVEPDSPDVVAPMHGVVVAFAVTEGDTVTTGNPIAVLEAMKMEMPVLAHRDGVITALTHAIGEVVDTGAVLAKIETSQGEDSWRISSR